MHSIQIGEARDVSESTLDILDMPKQQNQRMITSLKFVWQFKLSLPCQGLVCLQR